MSDFGPLKKVGPSNSVIRQIFKNVLVKINGHNHQISECFVKNDKKYIFWQGEGVLRKLGYINEWSLKFQMDGVFTKFWDMWMFSILRVGNILCYH